jgi:hypothetical protein
MISLEMKADEGHMHLRFDAPDEPGTKIRLDELAVFSLYLDAIKSRIVEMTNMALAKADGFDVVVSE